MPNRTVKPSRNPVLHQLLTNMAARPAPSTELLTSPMSLPPGERHDREYKNCRQQAASLSAAQSRREVASAQSDDCNPVHDVRHTRR